MVCLKNAYLTRKYFAYSVYVVGNHVLSFLCLNQESNVQICSKTKMCSVRESGTPTHVLISFYKV